MVNVVCVSQSAKKELLAKSTVIFLFFTMFQRMIGSFRGDQLFPVDQVKTLKKRPFIPKSHAFIEKRNLKSELLIGLRMIYRSSAVQSYIFFKLAHFFILKARCFTFSILVTLKVGSGFLLSTNSLEIYVRLKESLERL